jgi:hypothetical protein
MKFVVFVFIFAISTSAKASPWDAFVGCYDLTQINNQPVTPAKYFKSKIYEGIDSRYKNLDGQNIRSLVIKVNTYDSVADFDKTVTIPSAFLDMPDNVITTGDHSVTFEFRGRVLYTSNNSSENIPIWFVTRLTRNSDNSVTVIDDLNKIPYLLVPTDCPH